MMSVNDVIKIIHDSGYLDECIREGIDSMYFFDKEGFAIWLTYIEHSKVGTHLFGKGSLLGEEVDTLIKERY